MSVQVVNKQGNDLLWVTRGNRHPGDLQSF